MKVTQQDIKEIIEKAEVLGEVSSMKTDVLLSEQGIDSLDMVNVYLLIEEKFDIKIPDYDMEKVQTIDAIVNYINDAKS